MVNQMQDCEIALARSLHISSMSWMIWDLYILESSCELCANQVLFNNAC